MSFFEALNGGLESMFKELSQNKRLKEKRRTGQFMELESTPFLLDSSYLLELTEGANQTECDSILDYLYRFNNLEIMDDDGEADHLNILGIDSYKQLEQKIIDRKWK